ncbi:MAG: nickel-dependent lactate racemase [Actinomycetota bacterium]|nr:nickel-dependent lactate racemase [Actinomycetota bacterium]
MEVQLAYGGGGLPVRLPDDTTVIQPNFRPGLADPAGALRDALRAPVGRPPLRELVRPGQRVAISVCDVTRAQPRRVMVAAILEELDGVVRPQDVVVLVATGTHRANTPEELELMLGPEIVSSCRVVNHVARDPDTLEDLGVMPGVLGDEVPVALNREWVRADVKITTGFVEPHFFAGFSGGPKMVAPGLAGIDTVMVLHDAKRIGSPQATWGVTEGNPVHDDIRAIARRTGVDFAVDVLLNNRQEITEVFAGDLFEEHAAAQLAARAAAMQPVDEPFDLVVTSNSGYPLDQNLYQAVKGLSAAAKVVRDGGVIIGAAECRDGIPAHGSYAEILASRPSPASLLDMIESEAVRMPDQWQVQLQAKIQAKARVLMKTSYLSAAELAAAHFEAVDDVSGAVRDLLADAGPAARVCVLPEGPQTIPYLA